MPRAHLSSLATESPFALPILGVLLSRFWEERVWEIMKESMCERERNRDRHRHRDSENERETEREREHKLAFCHEPQTVIPRQLVPCPGFCTPTLPHTLLGVVLKVMHTLLILFLLLYHLFTIQPLKQILEKGSPVFQIPSQTRSWLCQHSIKCGFKTKSEISASRSFLPFDS